MSKSLYVHYKNKYPHAQVNVSESSLVVSQNGVDLVRMERDASGTLKCVSEAYGCRDRHDLTPIAKEARHRKFHADGKICLDDKAEERQEKCMEDMDKYYHNVDGILSAKSVKEVEEYKAPAQA